MRAKTVPINEIGEGSVHSVPFKYNGKMPENPVRYEYEFSTIHEKFMADFTSISSIGPAYIVEFGFITNDENIKYIENIENNTVHGPPQSISVNKGDMFVVMSTCVDIIKDFLNKNIVEKIIIRSKITENYTNKDKQRIELYLKFIDKQLPNGERDCGSYTENSIGRGKYQYKIKYDKNNEIDYIMIEPLYIPGWRRMELEKEERERNKK